MKVRYYNFNKSKKFSCTVTSFGYRYLSLITNTLLIAISLCLFGCGKNSQDSFPSKNINEYSGENSHNLIPSYSLDLSHKDGSTLILNIGSSKTITTKSKIVITANPQNIILTKPNISDLALGVKVTKNLPIKKIVESNSLIDSSKIISVTIQLYFQDSEGNFNDPTGTWNYSYPDLIEL